MATLSVSMSEFVSTTNQVSFAFASGWTEAATRYTNWVTNEQAIRLVSETEKFNRFAAEIGVNFRSVADDSSRWAQAARDANNLGIAKILDKYAEKFATDANRLLDPVLEQKANLNLLAADARTAVLQAEKAFAGEFGKAVGPAFDAYQMMSGAVDWVNTGNSAKFGGAAMGVLLSAFGGILGAAAVTFFGGPVLIVAFAAGAGAAIGSAFGDPLFGAFNESVTLLMKNYFQNAKTWHLPCDPILLDLDGNGLETVGLTGNAYFDYDGDGVLTKTGWVGKNDALLVWDRNTNGLIDSGAELFGDFTPLPNGALAPNGFAALAVLDSNGDGILDAADPAFTELKLWRDVSQDGVSQGGEFITLADAGIVSLNLAHTLKNQRLSNGNQLTRESSFTRADGSTSAMNEYRLAIDTFDTRFAEAIEVPEALKSLPNMGGAGKVRELQQAAAQSGTVAGVLAQFQSATTRAEQRQQIDNLLSAWAATSGMRSLEQRGGIHGIEYVANGTLTPRYNALIAEWRQKIQTLEAFNGQYFFTLPNEKNPTPGANFGVSLGGGGGGGGGGVQIPPYQIQYSQTQLDLLGAAYEQLKESVYGALVLQTRLKPYLDQIELIIDDAPQEVPMGDDSGIRLDAAPLNQRLADQKTVDPENYLADLLDLDRYASGLLSGTNWVGLADFDTLIESLPQTAGIAALLDEFKVRRLTAGDDTTGLTDKADIVLAGEGKDTLYGHNGNDRLFGQEGDDRIYGGSGDDLISGGAGNDVLAGESGADTYVFGRGYGNDTISDSAENGVQRDTVRLLGLTPTNIRVTADYADNLVFTIIDSGETLSVPRGGYWWGQNGVGQDTVIDGDTTGNSDTLRFMKEMTRENVRERQRGWSGACVSDGMLSLAA